MEPSSLSEIRTKALNLHQNGAKWHFHILTPTCQLNDTDSFAFVLEAENEPSLVFYSESAEKELAQELSPLLHGSDVMDSDSSGISYEIPEAVAQMRERALAMNEQNISWHHHMLFPYCIFNEHAPQYVLMVEDSSSGEAIVNVTDDEPSEDIKQIESLFFAAK